MNFACMDTAIIKLCILAYIDQHGRTGSRVHLVTVRPDSTGVWIAVVVSEFEVISIYNNCICHYSKALTIII